MSANNRSILQTHSQSFPVLVNAEDHAAQAVAEDLPACGLVCGQLTTAVGENVHSQDLIGNDECSHNGYHKCRLGVVNEYFDNVTMDIEGTTRESVSAKESDTESELCDQTYLARRSRNGKGSTDSTRKSVSFVCDTGTGSDNNASLVSSKKQSHRIPHSGNVPESGPRTYHKSRQISGCISDMSDPECSAFSNLYNKKSTSNGQPACASDLIYLDVENDISMKKSRKSLLDRIRKKKRKSENRELNLSNYVEDCSITDFSYGSQAEDRTQSLDLAVDAAKVQRSKRTRKSFRLLRRKRDDHDSTNVSENASNVGFRTVSAVPPKYRGLCVRNRFGAPSGDTTTAACLDPEGDEDEHFSDADESTLDDLEDHFLCAVCYEVMVKPHKIQPCSHTFCRLCLCQLNKASSHSGSQALCPLCRQEIVDCVYDQDLDTSIQQRHPHKYSERKASVKVMSQGRSDKLPRFDPRVKMRRDVVNFWAHNQQLRRRRRLMMPRMWTAFWDKVLNARCLRFTVLALLLFVYVTSIFVKWAVAKSCKKIGNGIDRLKRMYEQCPRYRRYAGYGKNAAILGMFLLFVLNYDNIGYITTVVGFYFM